MTSDSDSPSARRNHAGTKARPSLSRSTVVVIISALLVAGCSSSHKKSVGLDVDLYLHASSSDPADVMLQAGIGKRLEASDAAKRGTVHVRVVDGVVTLSGTVKEAAEKTEAERIARETEMTLNGTPIRAAGTIRNQLEVEP
jgi:hypothetical protein